MEKREPMYTVGGNVNWYNPLWRTEWKLLKNLRLQLLCVCVYVSACVNCFSHIQLLCDWTIARQAPLSMEFSRQKYWSRLPFPSPGDLPDPGTKPESPALQVYLYPLSHQGSYS